MKNQNIVKTRPLTRSGPREEVRRDVLSSDLLVTVILCTESSHGTRNRNKRILSFLVYPHLDSTKLLGPDLHHG